MLNGVAFALRPCGFETVGGGPLEDPDWGVNKEEAFEEGTVPGCGTEDGTDEEVQGGDDGEEKLFTSGTKDIFVELPVKVATPELIRLVVIVFRKLGWFPGGPGCNDADVACTPPVLI